jgi:hypothetical protein
MARLNGKIITHTITGTSEVDVMTGILGNRNYSRGMVAYVRSTQAGVAKVYYVDTGDTATELATKTMAAADLHVFDFDFPVPESKITFNADSGSGSVIVEVLHY